VSMDPNTTTSKIPMPRDIYFMLVCAASGDSDEALTKRFSSIDLTLTRAWACHMPLPIYFGTPWRCTVFLTCSPCGYIWLPIRLGAAAVTSSHLTL